MNIVTTSYSGYRPTDGRAVRTSVTLPHWFRQPHDFIEEIAPFGILGEPEWHSPYVARLDEHAVTIREHLERLAQAHTAPLVVLCWCARGADCHRRVFAEWMADRYGFVVPELRFEPTPVQGVLV